MNQLYKQIRFEFLNKKYYFFNQKTDVCEENCYGILCLFEESNIIREEIYKRFAKERKISIESNEYNWIINHIKLCSLYNIERYAFAQNKILEAIIEQKNTNMSYDFPLGDQQFKNHKILNKGVLCLNKSLLKECSDILKSWYIKKSKQ